MRFAQPSWLLVLLVLAFIGWQLPRLRLHEPLRALILVLLALVLADPQIQAIGRGIDLWVLVDKSASLADELEPRLPEMKALIERSKGADDRLHFVEFAEVAKLAGEGDEIAQPLRQQTNTGLAVELALGRMEKNRAARILVLSDGQSTEPLDDLAERLKAQQVPLDYRLIEPAAAVDFQIAALRLPQRVQGGEPFVIEVEIAGKPDGTVPCDILRNDQRIGGADISIVKGRGTARFTERLPKGGAYRYTARVRGENDGRPGNDYAEHWIEVQGGPRVLLVTAYEDDPLAKVLETQGFVVDVERDLGKLHPGRLTGARAVILNNVPAFGMNSEFLGALDFFVRSQGGGLLMAGGRQSFAAGGYFESAIDELLPVSMELRNEHRKLATAMAVVMDRSGSMGAQVTSGGKPMMKMDLANEGAARCVSLLGSMDAVALYAVDTQAHEVAPLTMVSGNQPRLEELARTITVGGGGICVPTGLRAAWAALKTATAGTRHIVVFADANDATQELGDYQTLIADMVKDGITISVIGLGNDTDSGGAFLKEVAEIGKGRIFFSANPDDLPAMFAQETVAVARSAFIKEPVAVKSAAAWMEIAPKPLQWPDAVDGYNLSYLRPKASLAALSGDSYEAPLVAFWQRGLGRTAAVSFALGGNDSQRVRAWANYGDFLQTLGRWLCGNELPPGIGLTSQLAGTELRVDLRYNNVWEEKLALSMPKLLLASGATKESQEIPWQRLEPGLFRAVKRLDPGQWVRGAVQIGEYAVPFGPVVAGSNVEWADDPRRVQTLRNVSLASGGTERLDLSKAWESTGRTEWNSLRVPLMLLVLLCVVADAALTRLGIALWKIAR